MSIQYPSIDQYSLSVRNLTRSVKDTRFQSGQPLLVQLMGQEDLWRRSGGFSCVYQIRLNNKKAALRTWIQHVDQLPERYHAIAAYLAKQRLSYFVEFAYIEKGIAVALNQSTVHYPVLYMEWAEGQRLNDFLDDNIQHSKLIRALAEEFVTMVSALHKAHISHGDLQDGNILVNVVGSKVQLKLIDYDSLCVPTLQGWPIEITGLPDYQHPNYKHHKVATEKADYFSELVIYLSLLAYAENPALWQRGQEKRLLFSQEDFLNPTTSRIFGQLAKMSTPVVRLAQQLRTFCLTNSIEQLLPLEGVKLGTPVQASPAKAKFSIDDLFRDLLPAPAPQPATAPPSTTVPPATPTIPVAPQQSQPTKPARTAKSAWLAQSSRPSAKPPLPRPLSARPYRFSRPVWSGLSTRLNTRLTLPRQPLAVSLFDHRTLQAALIDPRIVTAARKVGAVVWMCTASILLYAATWAFRCITHYIMPRLREESLAKALDWSYWGAATLVLLSVVMMLGYGIQPGLETIANWQEWNSFALWRKLYALFGESWGFNPLFALLFSTLLYAGPVVMAVRALFIFGRLVYRLTVENLALISGLLFVLAVIGYVFWVGWM